MDDYYRDMLEEGKRMENRWIPFIEKIRGIPIIPCRTKREQYEIGENHQGYEIKYDRGFVKTGNLFIEIAEKADPKNPDWIPSGIHRRDNTIFYCQGNLEILFIFEKLFLRKWFYEKNPPVIFGRDYNGEERSKGYLLRDPDPFMAQSEVYKYPGG